MMLTRLAVALALGSLTCCRAAPGASTVAPRAPARSIAGGFASPESVVGVGKRRFVSNIGVALAPLAKDGDGFISELDERGEIVDMHAFPRGGEHLDAPKGMAITGGRLYTADVDRVVGFDLESHAKVFDAAFPSDGPVMLNDLEVENERSLLVTDTARGALYRLDLGTRAFTTVAADIPGANGVVLAPERGLAYVVGIGTAFAGGKAPGDVFAVSLAGDSSTTRGARRLGGLHGLFDGVAVLSSDELVVSDWVALGTPTAGSLVVLSPTGERRRLIELGTTVHGPADFFYDRTREQIWLPQTLDHRVLVIDVGAR